MNSESIRHRKLAIAFLVVFAIAPIVLIPILSEKKVDPYFLLPFPWLWTIGFFIYIKKLGGNWKRWWMLILFPLVLLMFAYNYIVLGIAMWAGKF